jgi:hypothetical protein
MKTIHIYDHTPSTATDLDWARQQGLAIECFSAVEQPQAFTGNAVVKDFLERSGPEALPLVLVDGEVALAGRYPSRDELARLAGIPTLKPKTEGNTCCGGCC